MKKSCFTGWLALVVLSWSGCAGAATLFAENFEGYTSFPHQIPSGDYVNAGIPKISEGAQGVWYGARFERPDNGTINSDLAVQKFGGGSNNTHTGRVEDDAGMLFRVNTVGYANVTLRFDWRTFRAETTDRFVVGYYVGSLNFGACSGNGEAGCFRDFYNVDFGGNQNAAVNWWNTQWTQILRANASGSWQSVTNVALPSGKQDVWIAFWLDNGECDYGKFDNIRVEASPVPVPAAVWLFSSGLAGIGVLVRRRVTA